VPLCIANGRIYPADAGKYRLARGFFRRVLAHVSWLGVQSEADGERFLAMGAPQERIEVVGNLKYDKEIPHSSHHHGLVLLAASTHPPEEELILDAFLRLRDEMPELRCVLAPRQIARAGSIRSMARSRGLETARWTEPGPEDAGPPVVVVDEMGRLRDLFPRADVVIMGGSFAPRGGQNLLEPAAAGCAVVIGPNVEHFRAIVDDFLKRDAIRMVEAPSGLYQELSRLLRDEAARVALGKRAREAWEAGRGRAPVFARKLASIMREKREVSPDSSGAAR
jgi:3-deoxy-D-manno-octulosonic-acid transferase